MALKKEPTMSLAQQKEARLNSLRTQADVAVQIVNNAIEDLELLNVHIDQEIGEIDEILRQLSETRSGLDAERAKNTKVRKNFAELLCID